MTELNLSTLPTGKTGLIKDVRGGDRLRRRLMEMGLIPGAEVTSIRRAPLGDPTEVQVMHYHLTLRNEQAALIDLEDQPQANESPDTADVPPLVCNKHDGDIKRVALLGNPNCGKTSIFNALTGLQQKVANYPGVTVERRSGTLNINDKDIEIIDLPGTYSLNPNSPDERITTQVLEAKLENTQKPDAVIVVIDACNLERNLYLFTQLVEFRIPTIVALSMHDIASKSGAAINKEALEDLLGMPIVIVNGQNGDGLDELKQSINNAHIPEQRCWAYPEKIESACRRIGLRAEESNIDTKGLSNEAFGELILSGSDPITSYAKTGNEEFITWFEREQRLLKSEDLDFNQEIICARYQWIQLVAASVLPKDSLASRQNLDRLSIKLDGLLVHKFFGLISFLAIMASVFIAVFIIAAPIMDAFEGALVSFGQMCFGGMNDGPLKDLLLHGVVAGAGGVVIFVPQIAILSLFLAILEDSGYLARASFLMDRLLAFCGLHGKSFIPLLTSHACAIPGILAARSIEHPRERLATILVAPFMACGARLPVYALLITLFFAHYGPFGQAMVLLSLYVLGIIAAAFTAFIARKTALKGPAPASIMEFPPYRIPQFGQVARIVGRNSWLFCKKAGTIILAFSICLWAMLYYPQLDEAERQQIAQDNQSTIEHVEAILPAAASVTEINDDEELSDADKEVAIQAILSKEQLSIDDIELAISVDEAWSGAQGRQSIAGTAGRFLEPLISPMGYDWKIGVGLIGAFAAREVFVATMGTIYSVGEAAEDDESLHDAIRKETRADGSPLWTTPLALSLLVFFAIAMQCISTVAIVKQETGSWRWPLGQLLYMNTLAYVLAVIVYQVGTAIT